MSNQIMQNNPANKELVRVLLDDPENVKYTDLLITKLIDIFTIPELLVAILILNSMSIDFEQVKKFINIMNETAIGSNEPEEPANQQ